MEAAWTPPTPRRGAHSHAQAVQGVAALRAAEPDPGGHARPCGGRGRPGGTGAPLLPPCPPLGITRPHTRDRQPPSWQRTGGKRGKKGCGGKGGKGGAAPVRGGRSDQPFLGGGKDADANGARAHYG